jgi:hypothetical protein
MTYDFAAEFGDLDNKYPNSKRTRRSKVDFHTEEVPSWDAKPLQSVQPDGTVREFYLTNALASALNKSSVSIRLWERKGYIPKAPYRWKSVTKVDGTKVPGKRAYTKELIDIAVDEFGKRDLIETPRVEWSHHRDLTIAIYERWLAHTTSL